MQGLAFSPDGKRLAASKAAGYLVVWDAETGKELDRFENIGIMQGLTFSPDGKHVAGLGGDRAIHLWSLDTGREAKRFEAPASNGSSWPRVGTLSFSPDGKTLAAPQGSAIHLWSVETGKLLHRFTGHSGAVEDLRVSPDGRLVVSCGKDGMARQWDVRRGKEIASWTNPAVPTAATLADPDGESVLFAASSGRARAKLGEDNTAAAPSPRDAMLAYRYSKVNLSADGKTIVSGRTGPIDSSMGLGRGQRKKRDHRARPTIFCPLLYLRTVSFWRSAAPCRRFAFGMLPPAKKCVRSATRLVQDSPTER